MKLHADLMQRAVVHSPDIAWVDSPMPGVKRRMLERDGGEEVFVLEGSFADDHGRYGRGTWIREPAGSGHAPCTETGCMLYIKSGHLFVM